jgi:hypothetical protein
MHETTKEKALEWHQRRPASCFDYIQNFTYQTKRKEMRAGLRLRISEL